MIWLLKKLTKKTVMLFRGIRVGLLYKPTGFVKVLGKVYLDAPNVNFGKNVILYPNVHIFGLGNITIGDNVVIGDGTVICCAGEIVIESSTMIAAQCYIVDCNHGMHLDAEMRDNPLSIHPIYIARNVWIGCGCKVLAGSSIESGAVIGAGTVINGTVDKNTICYTRREYQKKARI